jgi:phosphopantothenoylcysteine decarboxylase/phosphopantothenate--cysteine ligase
VLVTAGPTREAIDPVRYISNRSSGKMGYALARAAHDMGARVTLVSGPVGIKAGHGVEVVPVESALEMYEAVMAGRPGCDVIVACAAVADYTPRIAAERKLKKKDFLTLELEETKDILAELGRNKSCYLAGFAAETHDVIPYAEEKLKNKNLDMIVANDVSRGDVGFDSDYNAVVMIKRNGGVIETPREPKERIARRVMVEIERDLAGGR